MRDKKSRKEEKPMRCTSKLEKTSVKKQDEEGGVCYIEVGKEKV